MIHKKIINLLIIIALVVCGYSLAEEGYEEARRLTESGVILPLEEIIPIIQAQQSGRILELELERERGRYLYEIELLDARGAVWEFKVNAATGEILERELED
jgi:uncharacterized membrane protein YkoI